MSGRLCSDFKSVKMISGLNSGRVFAYAAPCDMRKSYEGLGRIVREELGFDIIEGDLFVFTNRSLNRAKVLLFDGTGLCIYMKRLDKGRFPALWKRTDDQSIELSKSELYLFLEGSKIIEKKGVSPAKITRKELAIFAQI